MEEWLPDLRKDGYVSFYSRRSRQGRLPLGTQAYPDWLRKIFPDARHRPDLIALHKNGLEVLVGDVAAGPWSPADIRLGGKRKLPHGIGAPDEKRAHLEKTIDDAKQFARKMPDKTVHAQDRYREARGKVSKRIDVTALLRRRPPPAFTPPTGPAPPPTAPAPPASTARAPAPGDATHPPPARSRLLDGRPNAESRGVRASGGSVRPISRFRNALRIGLRALAGEAAGAVLGFLEIRGQTRRLEQEAVAKRESREQELQARMLTELRKPQSVRLFEASPFDQFWFRVKWHEIFKHVIDPKKNTSWIGRLIEGGEGPLTVRLVDVRIAEVDIVPFQGEPTVTYSTAAVSSRTESGSRVSQNIRERTLYQPIFVEFTQGQKLAAQGIRLSDQPGSHGVTWRQWLLVARDYINFARKFPELKALGDNAWARFRLELCGIPEAADMFTPKELEACKDERLLLRVRQERGTVTTQVQDVTIQGGCDYDMWY